MRQPIRNLLILCALSVGTALGAAGEDVDRVQVPDGSWTSVDIALIIDTSDSMQGLIDSARLALWDASESRSDNPLKNFADGSKATTRVPKAIGGCAGWSAL